MYTAQRDAVAELMRCKVREPEEFEWQRQQRFAWREHDKAALAETAGHALPYGFEFVGARRRLVPNAGTVRSFVFAVQAMAAWSCAVLAGPPGCGKTETMKELARLLGRFSLDLTCSSEITYATVTSMLAGLCHSGAWGCFDRIGCLPEGVLSVVAQQLSAVLAAQRGGAWRGAWTDGKAFTLQPTTAFFVPPPPRTKWTRRVPHPVLIGHAASLTQATSNTVSAHMLLRADDLAQTGTVPASLRAHCRVLALPEPDAVAIAAARLFQARSPPPLRTKWTRRVPHPY